jgi:ankyrin repeat protein
VDSSLTIEYAGAIELEKACREGDDQLCRQLLSRNIDCNKHARLCCSPLITAMRYRKDVCASLLIENGADINIQACSQHSGGGFQPAHYAVWYNTPGVLSQILEKGPRLSDMGVQPIHLAAYLDRTECLNTLLHYTSVNNDDPIYPMLNVPLRSGLNTGVALGENLRYFEENFLSYSPLHIAVTSRSYAVVSLLLGSGADLEAKESRLFTPLHVAAEIDSVTMAITLLEIGANVKATAA